MTDRCRAKRFCSASTEDGPAVTVRHETICPSCVVDVQRRLDELPHLRVALNSFLGGSMKAALESKVSNTPTPAVPLNLNAVVLQEAVDLAVEYAAGYRIQDLITQPAQEYRVWIKDVEQRVFLDGVDRALAIRRIHQRVTDAVGLAPVFQRRAAPCPSCDLPLLGQWSGTSRVECKGCEASMTLTEYDKWCMEKARVPKRRKQERLRHV